jgi:hypothetical protein
MKKNRGEILVTRSLYFAWNFSRALQFVTVISITGDEWHVLARWCFAARGPTVY